MKKILRVASTICVAAIYSIVMLKIASLQGWYLNPQGFDVVSAFGLIRLCRYTSCFRKNLESRAKMTAAFLLGAAFSSVVVFTLVCALRYEYVHVSVKVIPAVLFTVMELAVITEEDTEKEATDSKETAN